MLLIRIYTWKLGFSSKRVHGRTLSEEKMCKQCIEDGNTIYKNKPPLLSKRVRYTCKHGNKSIALTSSLNDYRCTNRKVIFNIKPFDELIAIVEVD